MSKPKFIISAEAQDNKAIIRIDGYISEWNNHALGFKQKVDALLEQGITDATIYINSGGGDCFQANEISNEIQRFSKTTAKLGALCASAVTYIACKCTTVIAAKNTSYMIHKPYGGLIGNSDELRSYMKLLDNLEKEYAKAYSDKTGMSVDKIKALWKNDYWMDTEELLEKGFINSVEGEADITEDDVQAMASYKGAPKIAASVKPTDTNPQTKIEMKDKLLLIFASVFTSATTEAEMVAHLETLKVKAAKADAAEKELKDFKEAALKEKAKAVVAQAKKDKKILASQEEYFIKNLIADFDATKKVIDEMPAVTKISDELKEGDEGAVDNSKWTYADFMEKDPSALKKMSEEDEPRFNALFEKHYGKIK